jgi:uncharacterized protein
LIKGFTVTVGRLVDKEIDFVAEKTGQKIYIQVAFSIPDSKVRQREFGNLLEIKDNFRKLVVSMDEVQIVSYQGIEHMHLRKFLTGF